MLKSVVWLVSNRSDKGDSRCGGFFKNSLELAWKMRVTHLQRVCKEFFELDDRVVRYSVTAEI